MNIVNLKVIVEKIGKDNLDLYDEQYFTEAQLINELGLASFAEIDSVHFNRLLTYFDYEQDTTDITKYIKKGTS